MLGLSGWDWVALVLYFVSTVVVGLWTVRRVKDTADFFMGGRRFGKVFMVFYAFGAGTSGNDAVGVSSKTYTTGFSGIWYQWLWLFCTPFYWLIAPVMRRMRCLTTGDYFEHRYDGSVAGLYTIVGVLQLTVNIGVISLGAGSMIEGITGGAIPKNYAILAMALLYMIYGVAGGLAAAIVTDLVQGILTIVLSFILIPFALEAAGGFTGLHDVIGREFADKNMFSLSTPGEINLFWIAMLGLNSLIGIVTQPHIMGVCAAGRTEMDGRVGFAGGNLIKRVCTIPWMLVGLCAVVIYLGTDIKPDTVFGQMASDLLPKVAPGLVGLFLAALIASVVDSCGAFMVSCSGLFTQNLYKRWLVRDRKDNHYVFIGRIAAFVIVLGGVGFSFMFDNVPDGLVTFFKLQAMMGPAFWIGLVWRRATPLGAWAATLTAFALMWGTSLGGFHAWAAGEPYSIRKEITSVVSNTKFKTVDDVKAAIDAVPNTMWEVAESKGVPIADLVMWNGGGPAAMTIADRPLSLDETIRISPPALPAYMIWNGKFRDSWQIFTYLIGGFGAGILVSLVTRRAPKERLDRVFNAIRTPVNTEEPHITEPFSLPAGLPVGQVRKVINHPDLEIYWPSATAVGGFALFWACVAILVGFVFWMATWGA